MGNDREEVWDKSERNCVEQEDAIMYEDEMSRRDDHKRRG